MAGKTDIDNLQIKINSSADGAAKQIDTLVTKLGSLTRALEKTTVDPSVASGLDLIAKSAKNFSESFGSISAQHIKDVGTSFQTLASGVNNVNKAINGVDFMKLANQASQLDTALDKKLNETLDEFGIKGKKNINLVKESFYGLMSELKSGNLEGALSPNVSGKALQALKDNARFAIEPSEDVREAQRLINAVKKAGTGGIGIDSRQSSEVAQIKESMTKYANMFSTTGNANQSINEFIAQNKLLVQTGLNEADTFRNLAQAINRAMATIKNAENSTIGYDQAIKQLGMDENYAAQAINGIIDEYVRVSASQERAAQTQRQNAAAMQSVSGLYKQFAQGLREVAAVDIPEGRATAIADLAHAVSQFGYAKIKTATQIIPALTREINNMLTVLSKSPEVSVNITRLINALARLTANGQTLKVATNALANGMNKVGNSARQSTSRVTMFGNALKEIHGQSINVLGGLRRLAGVFGTVYASLFMFVGAFRRLKEAIGYAADLTEIQNVVDVTFGNAASKIDEFTQTSIKDFGINELSVKTFAARYQSMGVAMGITNEQVKNAHEYLSQFRTPTGAINGYNELSNSMADMSINLTKLTGDLASFYDQNQEDVAQALQSGIFAGQTRPLRQYGVDLTQATLQEWALSQGINANIASMTQAEKTMLRYEYTMQRLGMAQGDFQRTQHTWANQVRVLRQQFQALGAVIGQGLIQALKPALIAFNAFLSRVIEFSKKVLNALGKIFGWKVDISASGLDTGLDGAEEAATGLGDALGGAGDAAKGASDNVKELNKQLQSFDKLNVLTTSDTGGSGGSGGGGGGSGSGGGGGAGAGSGGDVTASIEKTEGLFKSNIDNLFELGQYIRNTLMNAMDSIDWDSIYEKARGFGKGLAEFLNGLFSGTAGYNLFASLGKTIAGAINTALNFFDAFGETFDFSTFGRNLASFFVETIKNIDWTMAGKAFHEWMQGIKDAFVAFVDYLWKNKKEVLKALYDFFKEITIEDILIFISVASLAKITKWLFLGQGFKTASAAIAKMIGTIFIEEIGISIGAFDAASATSMTLSQMLRESIITALGSEGGAAAGGAAGGAGAASAIAIPIGVVALVAGLTYFSWDTDKTIEHNKKDKEEAIEKLRKSGMSDDEIAKNAPDLWSNYQNSQTIYDKVFGKDAGYYQGGGYGNAQAEKFYANLGIEVTDGGLTTPWDGKGFWTWLAEKMFPKSVEVNGKNVDINYFGGVGFSLGNGKKFEFPWKGKGFFRWLGGKLFPKTVTVNGKDVEINYGGNLGFKLGDGKKFEFPWKGKGFFKWLAEKLFPKTVKTTNGEEFSIDYDIDIKFNLGEKFGNGKFKTWLEEKIGVKNGESVTTAGITGKFNGWEQVKGGGALSDAWSYVKGWFKDHDFMRNWKPWSYVKGWFKDHDFVSSWKPWSYIKGWFNNWDWNKGWSPWSYIKGWFKGWDWASGWSPWSYIKGWFKNWDTASGWSPWSYIKGWFKNWDFASGWNPWSYIKGWFKNWDYASGWNPWSYIKGFFKNAQGGVLTASGWKPIQQYASGGLPSYGQVFVAREAGPELVGTLGGHTAVMNNDQIVASVANGVAQANMAQNQLLAQQNALLRQILAKETGISSRDVFNAVRSENNNYINRTGNSAFA